MREKSRRGRGRGGFEDEKMVNGRVGSCGFVDGNGVWDETDGFEGFRVVLEGFGRWEDSVTVKGLHER